MAGKLSSLKQQRRGEYSAGASIQQEAKHQYILQEPAQNL